MMAGHFSVGELLARALAIVDFYSPEADGCVANPTTDAFTITGLLERANCLNGTSIYMTRGDPVVLADAKACLCRIVGKPHLDLWEAERRRDVRDARWLLTKAAA